MSKKVFLYVFLYTKMSGVKYEEVININYHGSDADNMFWF